MYHPRGSSPPSSPPPPPPPRSFGDRQASRTFRSRAASRSPPPPPPPPASSHRTSADDRYYDRSSYYRPRSRSPPPSRPSASSAAGRYASPPPPPPAARYASPRRRGYDDHDASRSRSPGRHSGYRDEYSSSSRYDRYDRYDRYRDHDRYDDRSRRYHHHHHHHQRPYHAAPQRSHRPIRGSSKDREESTTLWVGNLPYSYLEPDVASMFDRYGKVRKVTVPIDQRTQRNKGFAFVEFEERRDAEDAYAQLDAFSIEGRRLKLDWDIGLAKKDQGRNQRIKSDWDSDLATNDQDRDRRYESRLPPPPPPPRSPDPYSASSLPSRSSREFRRDSVEHYR